MELIQQRITPALLGRVPSTEQVSVGQLYAYLENLCKPFRLFDLPAELRNSIYEDVVVSKNETVLLAYPGWGDRCLRIVPALAQATQQLREEVLPVYFSVNAFCTTASLSVGPRDMQVVLNHWKGRVLRNNAKSIRAFSIASRCKKEPGNLVYLHFTFDEPLGLQIECSNAILMPQSKLMLEELIKKVQSEHKGQDLKGESIILAVEKFFEVDQTGHRYVLETLHIAKHTAVSTLTSSIRSLRRKQFHGTSASP